MSKTKKGLIVAAVIILVAALLPVGLLSFQKWSDETASREAKESAKVDFQKYHTYRGDETACFDNNAPDYEWDVSDPCFKYYEKFMKTADSSYLIAKKTSVYGVSRKSFNDYASQSFGEKLPYDYNEVTKNLKYILTEMTGKAFTYDGGISWRMYPSGCDSAGERYIAAFKESLPLNELKAYKHMNSDKNILHEEGLRLKITNVRLQKIMLTPINTFCVMATAMVETKRKPAKFTEEWIPREGKSSKTTFYFIVRYWPSMIPWSVEDIAVKGYN